MYGCINAFQQYRHVEMYFGDLKLVWDLRVHKCIQNVDVYSDFDQNEAHFRIRYHTY